MTEREQALARAEQWKQHIVEIALPLETSKRQRAAASLLHLSIEHHSGIHCLVDHQLDSAAFALLRPQWETYVRGVWLRTTADEALVEKFLEDKTDLKFRKMLGSVEPEGRRQPMLDQNKAVSDKFNDFTHGGVRQISLRNRTSHIETITSDKEIAALVYMSITFCYQALAEIADLVGDNVLKLDLNAAIKKVVPPR